ncbi:hypothetical protein V8E36_000547 [Tilletia maclaganii]
MRKVYLMPDNQKEAIIQEIKSCYEGRSPIGHLSGLVIDSIQAKHQARLDLEELRLKHAELEEYCLDIEARLGQYETEDGEATGELLDLKGEARRLRTKVRALEFSVEADERKITALEATLATQTKEVNEDAVGLAALALANDKVVNLECIVQQQAALIQELRARDEPQQAKIRDQNVEIASLQRRVDAHALQPYHPPSRVDLNSVSSLRDELQRLSHNENVARRAGDFYQSQFEQVLLDFKDLEEEIENAKAGYRSACQYRADEMAALRRAMRASTSGVSEAWRKETGRWTKYEQCGYFGLPPEPIMTFSDRRSSPPVLVFNTSVNVKDARIRASIFASEQKDEIDALERTLL